VKENSEVILQVLAAYKSAVYEKNVAAFMQLYDENVRIFDTWGIWLFESAAARQPVIQQWLGSLGSERVTVNFDDVLVTCSHDIAIVSAIGTYAAISVDGVELRSMQNRFTWGLKSVENNWKIIHEHTSVPIANDLIAKLIRD
jgi:ketosteroid isomerase-like protein